MASRDGASNSVPCPHCGHTKAATKDSRVTADGRIRRRKVCASCGLRFTTHETIETQILGELQVDEVQAKLKAARNTIQDALDFVTEVRARMHADA